MNQLYSKKESTEAMSKIKFKCPHCNTEYSADERIWGSRVQCQECKRYINLMGPKPTSFWQEAGRIWDENKSGVTYLVGKALRSILGG